MKERPILFSAPMVRAILDGSKTQTRRIVKPGAATKACARCVNEGVPHNNGDGGHGVFGVDPYLRVGFCEHNDRSGGRIRCHYGIPGDRLWVRETFSTSGLTRYHDRGNPDDHGGPNDPCCAYAATGDYRCGKRIPDGALAIGAHRWRPSIHMPRWASRIALAVESVRVERLCDIGEEDARAEGVEAPEGWTHRQAFARLWRQLHESGTTGSWDANPWAWVIGFSRVMP